MNTIDYYRNPIISGFNPDPSIIRVREDYYLCTSSFEFFPGVPLYHSKNLVDWRHIGYCLTRDSQLPLENARPSSGIFAPTMRYHQGTFYMITTNMNRMMKTGVGNFIVHTEEITGEWSEPVWIDHIGIDPSLFFDEDGRIYYCGTGNEKGGECIVLFEINPKTGEILSDKKVISQGCGGRCPEAPHIYKINGNYYLMLAEGGTEYGHMVTIQRADNIEGPYEPCPHNPILTHRDNFKSLIQCIGHGDMVEDHQGNWWMVLLGVRPTGSMLHHLGRETFLTPFEWKDGWPVLSEVVAVENRVKLPSQREPLTNVFETEFDEAKIPLEFNWVRNPEYTRYLIDEKRHVFCLSGDEKGLSNGHNSPTFMGVRQKEFETVTTTKLYLNLSEGTIAGLSAYYMDTHHYEIRVICENGLRYVELNKCLYDMEYVTKRQEIKGDIVELQIRSDRNNYYFSYRVDDEAFIETGTATTVGLSTETMEFMTFTGTYIGIFAQNGMAEFDSFRSEWTMD